MKVASKWSVNRSSLLSGCLLFGSQQQPTRHHLLLPAQKGSFKLLKKGRKEEIFYTDKMLMLSSCAPVRFKGQSNCLGHSSSVPYVQMDFGDERRRQFGVQTVVFGSLIHLQASQQGHIVACVS